jgi:hypothetical protein
MKLVVERTGGFAGLKRRGARNGEDLSPEQRAALDQLIAASDQEKSAGKQQDSDKPAVPGAAEQDPGADRFTYRLEIQDENGTRSITVPESEMPKELMGIALQWP